MAMVDVDDSCQFSADSQPKSTGGHPALSLHSSDEPGELSHEDSTIKIVMAIIIIIINMGVLMCTEKLTSSRLNLPHGTKNKKSKGETCYNQKAHMLRTSARRKSVKS